MKNWNPKYVKKKKIPVNQLEKDQKGKRNRGTGMHQKECLRINLTKEEKDLCTENCKTPRRDTAEDRHKWTGALYDGPEEQR